MATMRIRAAAAALLLISALALVACGSGRAHVVEFDLLETQLSTQQLELPVDKIQYGWTLDNHDGPEDGGVAGSEVKLPWHHTETIHGDIYELLLDVELSRPQLTDFDQMPIVQCQLTLDGKVVMTHTAQGAVTCDATGTDLRTASP